MVFSEGRAVNIVVGGKNKEQYPFIPKILASFIINLFLSAIPIIQSDDRKDTLKSIVKAAQTHIIENVLHSDSCDTKQIISWKKLDLWIAINFDNKFEAKIGFLY